MTDLQPDNSAYDIDERPMSFHASLREIPAARLYYLWYGGKTHI
jgi:hypothetical protein